MTKKSLLTLTVLLFSPLLQAADATVSWTAPTQNVDGTALTDLAGYKVYLGADPNNLSEQATLNDPLAVNHTITDLTNGTWYVRVSAFDTSGNEGPLSNSDSKTVDDGNNGVPPAAPTDVVIIIL